MQKNKINLNSTMFVNIVKIWLVSVLVILPCQYIINKSILLWDARLSGFINYIDELTIVIFFPLAISEFYINRNKIDRQYFLIFIPLLMVVIAGIISAFINANSFLISSLGIFDYIKNFLVIFIYAAFFRNFNEFKKVFRVALTVALFMGGVALLQELWAVVYKYILQKDIYDSAMYIFRETPRTNSWRFGIYRTASFMYNPNLLGLYSLLFFTIVIYITKKINVAILIPLVTGIIVSVSRMVYVGFAIVIVLQILKGRKWFSLLIIPAAIILVYMSTMWDFNLWKMSSFLDSSKLSMVESSTTEGSPMINNAISYRAFSYNKAMEVWKDQPYFGVGPGKFGGLISVKYNSHLYNEYNFTPGKALLEKITSLDQFWPQLIAETGIVGTYAFAGLFISMFLSFFLLRKYSTTKEVRGLFEGLIVYLIIILIYTLGSGLNLNALLFTYCAFAGMGLGCIKRDVNNDMNIEEK